MQKQIELSDVMNYGINLPYVYFVNVSEVFIGKTEDRTDIKKLAEDAQSLIELRFFNNTEEYKIYNYDGTLHAVYTSDEGVPENYLIRKQFNIGNPKFGKSIDVCCYISSDEDGQNYISYSRLCGWK